MVVEFSFSDMLNVVMVNDHSYLQHNYLYLTEKIWLIEFQEIKCLKKTGECKI